MVCREKRRRAAGERPLELSVLLRLGVTGALSVAVSVGCGEKKHEVKPDSKPVRALTQTPQPPAAYSFNDQDCQDGPSPEARPLSDGVVYTWQGLKVVPVPAKFHDTSSGPGLSSQAVKATVAGQVYQRTCDGASVHDFNCTDAAGASRGWALRQAGVPLRLCQTERSYERESVETIGLTSLYFIQTARDRYLEATAGDGPQRLEAIGLSVLPAFVTDVNVAISSGEKAVVRSYITNNLAYFPDAQMIAVFPVKAVDRPRLSGFYWESSFVLGHEYGHHIDFSRHGRVLTNVGLRWEPLAHGFVDEAALAGGFSGQSARAQMAGAEAEAFADLLGYYTSGASREAIIGLPQIGTSRDVGDQRFDSSGSVKVLTPERLAILLGRAASSEDSAFRDIHTTGAVLAYTANQIFLTLTKATTAATPGSRDEINERYRLALSFMDSLTAEVAKLSTEATSRELTGPIATAVLTTTTQALARKAPSGGVGAVQAAVCEVMRTHLPAVTPTPFATGDHCS